MKRENDAFSRAQSNPSGFTGCAAYRKERFPCGRKAPYHAARDERIASATTSVSVRPLAASSGPEVRTDAARARDVNVRQGTAASDRRPVERRPIIRSSNGQANVPARHVGKHDGTARCSSYQTLDFAWIDNKFADCGFRSEEHTSELQSLMRISYAVFCLKKKKKIQMYNP